MARAPDGGCLGFWLVPWRAREFALYDLDRNSLTFYRWLARAHIRPRRAAAALHPEQQ